MIRYDQESARKGLPDRVKEAGRGRSDCKDDMRSIPPPPGVIFALPWKTPSNSCFEGFLLLLCSHFALACSPLADIHSSVYFSAPFRLAFCSLSRSVFQGKYGAARFYSRAWQWPRTLQHCWSLWRTGSPFWAACVRCLAQPEAKHWRPLKASDDRK